MSEHRCTDWPCFDESHLVKRPEPTHKELIGELQRVRMAIYISVAETVADEIAKTLDKTRTALEADAAEIAKLNAGAEEGRETVSSMAAQLDSVTGRCEELEALVREAVTWANGWAEIGSLAGWRDRAYSLLNQSEPKNG